MQNADYIKGGNLNCIDWRPREDLFPSGLPNLTQYGHGGIPLMLYSWGFAGPAGGNRMDNFTWVDSFGGDGNAMVQLNETYAFYSMIRDRFLAYNGSSMEEDNIGSWSSAWSQTQTTPIASSQWWSGFASPWCESGIPMQVCEAGAKDLLESLQYGCVTSSR